MGIEIANLTLHTLLVLLMLYFNRRANKLETMLIKCLQGVKPTEEDLRDLEKPV